MKSYPGLKTHIPHACKISLSTPAPLPPAPITITPSLPPHAGSSFQLLSQLYTFNPEVTIYSLVQIIDFYTKRMQGWTWGGWGWGAVQKGTLLPPPPFLSNKSQNVKGGYCMPLCHRMSDSEVRNNKSADKGLYVYSCAWLFIAWSTNHAASIIVFPAFT